jgi:pyrroloquinoline quinone (PQQ) biosynthesis protein C
MGIARRVESIYADQSKALADSPAFQRLESGLGSKEQYEDFLSNLFITHFQSPKVMAFLFAVAPPQGAETVQHNLMEELGLEEGEASHPQLLKDMLLAAGFGGDRIRALEEKALLRIKSMACDPLLYGTLMEAGLAVLLEASAFEWMLSRLSRRMGDMVGPRLGLGRKALSWFYHHSEVDIRHAQEALEVIEAYCAYYKVAGTDLGNILEITFRENVFSKAYFGIGPIQAA